MANRSVQLMEETLIQSKASNIIDKVNKQTKEVIYESIQMIADIVGNLKNIYDTLNDLIFQKNGQITGLSMQPVSQDEQSHLFDNKENLSSCESGHPEQLINSLKVQKNTYAHDMSIINQNTFTPSKERTKIDKFDNVIVNFIHENEKNSSEENIYQDDFENKTPVASSSSLRSPNKVYGFIDSPCMQNIYDVSINDTPSKSHPNENRDYEEYEDDFEESFSPIKSSPVKVKKHTYADNVAQSDNKINKKGIRKVIK